MKKILISLLILSQMVFANQNGANSNGQAHTQATQGSTTIEEQKKIFSNLNDAIVDNGKCSWECRDVKSGYATQIIGFDFKNGKTFCRVYKKEDLNLDLKFDASRVNLTCAKEVRNGAEAEITNYANLRANVQDKSSITYNPSNSKITFTKFLVALATLNPQIIDREKTKQEGELILKDGIENFSITHIKRVDGAIEHGLQTATKKLADFFESPAIEYQPKKKPFSTTNTSLQQTSAVDGFNKNNMAYFSDLFLANEKIYQHLQILIFVLVGGFFVTRIGAEKIQAYLENRGESAGKQPYLHKFYIPIIMVGTFFMPIPEANGLAHSTIIQNTIRYFAMKSTEIADMASAIGGKTYMDKIYKSVGGINQDGYESLIQKFYLNEYKAKQAEIIYKDTCSKRYEKPASSSDTLGYLKLSDKEKETLMEQSKLDRNKVAGSKYDISLDACIFLEQEINNAKIESAKLKETITGIGNFYSGNEVKRRLESIDTYFAIREKQLGWINSLLTPSSALLAEMTTLAQYKINQEDVETSTKKNIENNKNAMKNKDVDVSDNDDLNGGVIGFIMGRLVWFMLPGADSVKSFIESVYSAIQSMVSGILSLETMGVGGIASYVLTSLAKTPLVYFLSSYVIEEIYSKIPLLACVVASTVAFVSYLISLCKYFYVSPFVVAFSLATKRMDKIIEFLISGMAIFLRPTLIVIFIYLALFVHTLINELFIFLSVEQFTGFSVSKLSPSGLLLNFTANGIIGLLKIFGYIFSLFDMEAYYFRTKLGFIFSRS